jgi:D-alanyl-D-alanine carboxypeptidase
MAPGPPRDAPLRGNGRRLECFLRPVGAGDRRAIGISIHRKSDGVLLARGCLRLTGRVILLRIDRASRDFVPRLVRGELSPLLAARHPRGRLEISHARMPLRVAGTGPARGARPDRTRVRAASDPAARRLAAVRAEVPKDYGPARDLAPQREPRWLAFAGQDHAGRECWLAPEALRAWRRMAGAALADGVALVPVSGFRSADYQTRILAAKRARGLTMAEILAVNAAPGYSEHHTGRALDLTTPGCPPAEPEFEATAAFRWLAARAHEFGFRMSYPRGNPHGIVPEPWHWFFVGFGAATVLPDTP